MKIFNYLTLLGDEKAALIAGGLLTESKDVEPGSEEDIGQLIKSWIMIVAFVVFTAFICAGIFCIYHYFLENTFYLPGTMRVIIFSLAIFLAFLIFTFKRYIFKPAYKNEIALDSNKNDFIVKIITRYIICLPVYFTLIPVPFMCLGAVVKVKKYNFDGSYYHVYHESLLLILLTAIAALLPFIWHLRNMKKKIAKPQKEE